MHAKLDLQIAQCVHGVHVCALQSSSSQQEFLDNNNNYYYTMSCNTESVQISTLVGSMILWLKNLFSVFRQTCIPLTGEVDSLLENFAKTHR